MAQYVDTQNAKNYLMESTTEALRLEVKTDKSSVKRQAIWAGVKAGMKVLDVGCGSGAATAVLADLVGPSGQVVGIDFSEERLAVAGEHYQAGNVDFALHDIRKPYVSDISFDVVWSRFFLEYFRKEQRQIVINSTASLKAGGIACMGDLDNNSLGHYGLSRRLQDTLQDILFRVERDFDFDPYAGRRLYGHFYELGFKDIACHMEAHHLVYGQGTPSDNFNWLQKVDVAARKSGCTFEAYDGKYQEFRNEVEEFISSSKRFTYTPLILVRGIKPE